MKHWTPKDTIYFRRKVKGTTAFSMKTLPFIINTADVAIMFVTKAWLYVHIFDYIFCVVIVCTCTLIYQGNDNPHKTSLLYHRSRFNNKICTTCFNLMHLFTRIVERKYISRFAIQCQRPCKNIGTTISTIFLWNCNPSRQTVACVNWQPI